MLVLCNQKYSGETTRGGVGKKVMIYQNLPYTHPNHTHRYAEEALIGLPKPRVFNPLEYVQKVLFSLIVM